MKIRHATLTDAREFREMWLEYLQDQWDKGGDIKPLASNVDAFVSIFHSYVSGLRPGICLFAGEDSKPAAGVLLWGDASSGLITRWGRLAQGWGTYIRKPHRRKGLAGALREVAMIELKMAGFGAVQGTALKRNDEGLQSGLHDGFTIYSEVGILKLTEEED